MHVSLSDGRTRRRLRSRAARALLALMLPLPVALSACSGGDATTRTANSGSFNPVTIPHAFGSTTIASRPDRVVTWGWGSSDAALALGVVPVAMPRNSYGADTAGLMPWQADKLAALGAPSPTLLPETETPPFEEIAKARPQVILANYSGITKADYDKLTRIAPTVAYPEQPWSTPWRDVVRTTGSALGRSSEAQQLLDGINSRVQDEASRHPEFRGKTIAAISVDPSAFYVYKGADPRVQFLTDLGFTLAPSVDRLANGGESFYYTLSLEKLDELSSDVLLSYADTRQRADEIVRSQPLQAMAQVRNGTVASVVGEANVSSVSPPTALSLTWSLDEFVTQLSAAAKKADTA